MTDLSMGDEVPRPEFDPIPHAYDRQARPIFMNEAPLRDSLVLLAKLWAATHPLATVETRMELAARIASELAAR
ncbi:MAG: hypothetical protein ABF783_01825 [Komagataeibacter rhaeticus]